MHYMIWILVGGVVAILVGAGPHRRTVRPNANPTVLAGAFGAVIGGVISDGVPHSLAGSITPLSLVGAVIGALIFCWATHDRASDYKP
jgi:uncharacterized membrane protein YeaQ/YmgE (transglycosylase-associated protein family)